jgi:tRNA pseudouridine32 synthase/23S rRNA pseudouridine746 synthase
VIEVGPGETGSNAPMRGEQAPRDEVGLAHFERHIDVDTAITVLDLLRERTPVSGQRLKQAMVKGAVWVTRGKSTVRVRRAKRLLRPKEVLHLYYDERILARIPTAPGLIADEGAYSVWRKPYGMLSQGSKWGDHCTLNRWCEKNLQPERSAFVVHRLDRAATGLMLIAHEKRAAAALSELFRERKVTKRYRAVVHGAPKADALPLVLDTPIDGREALSQLERVEYDSVADRSQVLVSIHTGRKHQVRLHLAGLGHPIVGDRAYGSSDTHEDLQLEACLLQFLCPITGVQRSYQLLPS